MSTVAAHGARLVSRVLEGEAREEALVRAGELPLLRLGGRALADLEMLAVGAYSPLEGFMRRADYLQGR